jgi:hypothetical protein
MRHGTERVRFGRDMNMLPPGGEQDEGPQEIIDVSG